MEYYPTQVDWNKAASSSSTPDIKVSTMKDEYACVWSRLRLKCILNLGQCLIYNTRGKLLLPKKKRRRSYADSEK